jgi:hypothetical protein
MPNTSLPWFQSLSDSPRNAAPSPGFDLELFPSSLGSLPQGRKSSPLPRFGAEQERASLA